MTTTLPDDIDELKCMLLTLHAQNLHQAEQLNAQTEQLNLQAEQIIELKNSLPQALEQLNLSQAKRFGSQSEKTPKGTFNEAEQIQALDKASAKPAAKKGRQPLPAHLEREERNYELVEPVCECCGQPLHVCGVEESEQIKIIPAKISVIRHRQTKYACRHCEQTAERCQVVTAPKPAQPLPQSIASPETLAAVDHEILRCPAAVPAGRHPGPRRVGYQSQHTGELVHQGRRATRPGATGDAPASAETKRALRR